METIDQKMLGELINEYLSLEAQLDEMKHNCVNIRRKIERVYNPGPKKRFLTQLEIDKRRIHLDQCPA